MSAGRLARTKLRTSSANFCSSGVKARSMQPSRDGLSFARSLATRPVGTSTMEPDGGLIIHDAEPLYVRRVLRQVGLHARIERVSLGPQSENKPLPVRRAALDPVAVGAGDVPEHLQCIAVIERRRFHAQ